MDFLNLRAALCAASALICCASATGNQYEYSASLDAPYDLRRLMRPTAAELASESKGRVHIYDSLEISALNKALNDNFDRIQNMMFTRIHHLPPTGSWPAEVEEDGYD